MCYGVMKVPIFESGHFNSALVILTVNSCEIVDVEHVLRNSVDALSSDAAKVFVADLGAWCHQIKRNTTTGTASQNMLFVDLSAPRQPRKNRVQVFGVCAQNAEPGASR